MSSWSDEEDNILRALWERGVSASSIATELVIEGFEKRSRNAVIGRTHRLGLFRDDVPLPPRPPRMHRLKPVEPIKLAVQIKPEPQPDPPVVERPADRPGISIHDLDALMMRCRYPLWDDDAKLPVEEQMYCGDAVRIGRSYCPYHCSIAYAPPAERRRAA